MTDWEKEYAFQYLTRRFGEELAQRLVEDDPDTLAITTVKLSAEQRKEKLHEAMEAHWQKDPALAGSLLTAVHEGDESRIAQIIQRLEADNLS